MGRAIALLPLVVVLAGCSGGDRQAAVTSPARPAPVAQFPSERVLKEVIDGIRAL